MIAGSLSIAATSVSHFLTTYDGRPAGPVTPIQETTRTFGKPASLPVATFGSVGQRWSAAMPTAFTSPPVTSGTDGPTAATPNFTLPCVTSVAPLTVPLEITDFVFDTSTPAALS